MPPSEGRALPACLACQATCKDRHMMGINMISRRKSLLKVHHKPTKAREQSPRWHTHPILEYSSTSIRTNKRHYTSLYFECGSQADSFPPQPFDSTTVLTLSNIKPHIISLLARYYDQHKVCRASHWHNGGVSLQHTKLAELPASRR